MKPERPKACTSIGYQAMNVLCRDINGGRLNGLYVSILHFKPKSPNPGIPTWPAPSAKSRILRNLNLLNPKP